MKLNARSTIVAVAVVAGLNVCAARVVAQAAEHVIKIRATKFSYTPDVIELKKGEPVILEFTIQDVLRGFNVPDSGARVDIFPRKITRIRIVPEKVGTFSFHCDIFCGSEPEDTTGAIIVTE